MNTIAAAEARIARARAELLAATMALRLLRPYRPRVTNEAAEERARECERLRRLGYTLRGIAEKLGMRTRNVAYYLRESKARTRAGIGQ